MIIVLHLLNDNVHQVFIGVPNVTFPCFSTAFRKQTGPKIREHIIQIELQSLQWTNIKLEVLLDAGVPH
jgi:hypothetical protein